MPVTAGKPIAGSGRSSVPRAAVVEAVHSALHRDLAESEPDAESCAHLLGVADVVLHRAVLEDLRAMRRTSAAGAIADGSLTPGLTERGVEL